MAQKVIVGEIAGAFGVKGWVKIYSHTDPPINIVDYSPWILETEFGKKEYKVLSAQSHGAAVVALLEGIVDRDQALKLKRSKILTDRDNFPSLAPGRFYWTDLIGLRVINMEGDELGAVVEVMPTGANDVVVVKGERERLIPFVMERFVKEVDLVKGILQVDWDPEY